MRRVVHVAFSFSFAFSALTPSLVAVGCSPGNDQGTVRLTSGQTSPDDRPAVSAAQRDIVIPASIQTAAETGISSWVLRMRSDGSRALQGMATSATRFVIDLPPYSSHTAGSLTISIYDGAGNETTGWLAVVDGKIVDRNLPAVSGDLARHMREDMSRAPVLYNWSDCNTARQSEASAVVAVAASVVAVTLATAAVVAACSPPAVIIVVDCLAASAAEAAAIAALTTANAGEVAASQAVHAACDNLCASDSWCTGQYGSGWSYNSDGTCEQVTSTVCFECQTVSCGWDYTCATSTRPAPSFCGDCCVPDSGSNNRCAGGCTDYIDSCGVYFSCFEYNRCG